MDPVSLASTLITGRTQFSLAAEVMKVDMQNAQSIAAMIDSAQGKAALGPGQGKNLDITV
jgi:hypothetical protein